MGRRDYEMEAAVQSVEGHVPEPIVRALIVGSAGSNYGTLGGVFKQFFPADPPARTVCGVQLSAGMKIEIECIALA